MIFGSIVFGPLLDRFGYKVGLVYLLCLITGANLFVLALNGSHTFSNWAYVSMFWLGMMENNVWCFTNVILGFEFESKITPFGAKQFIETLSIAILSFFISFFQINTLERYRAWFIFGMIWGQASILILFLFKFKDVPK